MPPLLKYLVTRSKDGRFFAEWYTLGDPVRRGQRIVEARNSLDALNRAVELEHEEMPMLKAMEKGREKCTESSSQESPSRKGQHEPL